MKIELWFPTAVYTHKASTQESTPIEIEVSTILQQEHEAILQKSDCAARSYTQSRALEHRQVIQKYQLEHLHHFIMQHCAALLKKLHPSARSAVINESWFNFYQPNDYQEVHNHVHATKPSFLSGCFYIDAPKNSGDLKIYHPNFYAAIPADEGALETFETCYSPVKHQLIMFRSHVAHSVTRNRSNKTRTSLAFNISVE